MLIRKFKFIWNAKNNINTYRIDQDTILKIGEADLTDSNLIFDGNTDINWYTWKEIKHIMTIDFTYLVLSFFPTFDIPIGIVNIFLSFNFLFFDHLYWFDDDLIIRFLDTWWFDCFT